METVLITGTGRGIGFKLVEDFLLKGDDVIGTVRSQSAHDKLQKLADSLEKQIEIHFLDVTSAKSIDNLKESLNKKKIDILINNAGVMGGAHQTYDDLDFEEWERTFQVNTIAPMRIALALLPNLYLSNNAKIIAISSIMGSLAREKVDSIAYRSSKSALNKSMQCLALELKPKEIGVYLMHPGWVRTDMGGPEADISVEASSTGLIKTLARFTLEHSGRFWQYDGEELAW
jgi:short-subunit dehydrogenase